MVIHRPSDAGKLLPPEGQNGWGDTRFVCLTTAFPIHLDSEKLRLRLSGLGYDFVFALVPDLDEFRAVIEQVSGKSLRNCPILGQECWGKIPPIGTPRNVHPIFDEVRRKWDLVDKGRIMTWAEAQAAVDLHASQVETALAEAIAAYPKQDILVIGYQTSLGGYLVRQGGRYPLEKEIVALNFRPGCEKPSIQFLMDDTLGH